MEELQSTEALDQEILEDARKKAHRILKSADETIQAKSAQAEKNIAAALAELNEKYAAQTMVAADEIMALLPIDKHRIKAKKIEELLNSAVAAWYAALSRQRVLDLLKSELAKRLANVGDLLASGESASGESGEMRILLHKVEQAEAQAILQAVLPGKVCKIETMPPAHVRQSTALYPEIILETPDLRIYASIGKTVDYFLGEQRAELTTALIGKAALQGEQSW